MRRAIAVHAGSGHRGWFRMGGTCTVLWAWPSRGMRGACVALALYGVVQACYRRGACLGERRSVGVLASVLEVRGGMHALGMRNNHKAAVQDQRQGRNARTGADRPSSSGSRRDKGLNGIASIHSRSKTGSRRPGKREAADGSGGLAQQTPGS